MPYIARQKTPISLTKETKRKQRIPLCKVTCLQTVLHSLPVNQLSFYRESETDRQTDRQRQTETDRDRVRQRQTLRHRESQARQRFTVCFIATSDTLL